MEQMKSRVKALGEIALRVENLEAMQQFYQEVIGLRLLKQFDHAVFFKVADGFEGHTQVLVLFDRREQPGYQSPDASKSTIDHIAFAISPKDFEIEKQRLEGLGLQVDLAEHSWVRWRSLYVTDPDGNRIELVCYDERVV